MCPINLAGLGFLVQHPVLVHEHVPISMKGRRDFAELTWGVIRAKYRKKDLR